MNIEYRNEKGELHREDGPAYINSYGDQKWYQNGKLHRKEGPAMNKWNNSCKSGELWYQDGHLHRIEGPAND